MNENIIYAFAFFFYETGSICKKYTYLWVFNARILSDIIYSVITLLSISNTGTYFSNVYKKSNVPDCFELFFSSSHHLHYYNSS